MYAIWEVKQSGIEFVKVASECKIVLGKTYIANLPKERSNK